MKAQNRSLGYAWEQLYGAISSLATSNLGSRERLLDAVTARVHLIFPSSSTHVIPPGINDRLDRLEKQVTKHGTFAESIEKMSDDEVRAAIEEIISLFSAVASAPSGKTMPKAIAPRQN